MNHRNYCKAHNLCSQFQHQLYIIKPCFLLSEKAFKPQIRGAGFGLHTETNAEVRRIHPKAMPVILRTEAEMDAWMNAPWPDAAGLQRPLPDGALAIVARGEKIDGQIE
jgi:putative SOS response-associated peptidase YedK